jgi:hypothetical protein
VVARCSALCAVLWPSTRDSDTIFGTCLIVVDAQDGQALVRRKRVDAVEVVIVKDTLLYS